MNTNYKIYINVSDTTACSYYRAILPFLNCGADLEKLGITLICDQNLSQVTVDFDAYIFHRTINPAFFSHLVMLKEMGKTIVWDLDDQLFRIPSWSPATELASIQKARDLGLCLRIADKITLTTQRFKDQFSGTDLYEKIVVLPNLINLNDYNFRRKAKPINNWPIKIMWAGSLTHEKDLDVVAPALDSILGIHDDSIRLIFMGMSPKLFVPTPETVDRYKRLVTNVGACELFYYPGTLESHAPDIAILPIIDCDFNTAKSNIKYLEMCLTGSACIGSNIGPYADTIEHEKDGLLTENTNESWFESFQRLIYDQDLRIHISRNGTQKVIENYSWTSDAKNSWINFFVGIANQGCKA
jgi:processive 1,2-diacylglycerol beta-glucosyltransferase